jgi:endonuclease G
MKRLMIFFLLMAVAALSAAGQTSSKTAELGWLELPSFSEDPEHFFVSHHTDEYWGKQRNYSLFWDQERQIPLWVAYPLNQRLIGKGKRSGAWQYDKFMATRKQPNLRRTYQAGSVEGYIRGHLCPSNDRMRPGMNEQTFYFTNMAPQDPYLNGGLWAWLEEYVQQLALSAQDAWVVTGCIDTVATNWVTDVTGKRIAVPEAFFKAVLLRYQDDDGSGERYEARAWIVENRNYGFSGFEQKASALEVSIDQLEGIIVLDLFTNLVRMVGAAVAGDVEAGR